MTDELMGACLADKYMIEERLGSGGMCDVYRARHVGMDKPVAVKVLKPHLSSDPKIAKRFEQEARAASRIHHPHAISVTDYGMDHDKTPFIVMELVKGETLGQTLRTTGAFSVERAANILRQVCGALEAAHSVGVIHRDIKPENIILAEYDGSDWVEVVDFGVAKVLEDVNRRGALTGANIIVGTPRYMSPEQCEEKPVDARSDIYSVGVVLYEMLTGEAPFEGDSSTRLLMAHASAPPAPLREKRPDISAEVEAVVMKALEKDPARRPQSAAEFAREFEQAAGLGQSVRAGTRGGAFSRISVPIGEDEMPTPAPDQANFDEADEATLVRPRSRIAADTPAANTPINNTPINQAPADPYDRRDSGVREVVRPAVLRGGYVDAPRRGNGATIAIVVVLLLVAGVAGYLLFGNRLFGASTTGEAVVDALQAIAEASARVDSLPKDHALRSYLPQLAEWQGELRAYQEVKEYNSQIVEKAERYEKRAEDISAQARAALAGSPREQTTNSNNGNGAPANASTPPKPAAEPGAEEEDPDASEEEEEPAPENKNASRAANKNTPRPPKPEPPVIDPIKPTPADPRPPNSNRPRNNNGPPVLERIEQ
ncbi:MAG TPA: serine/threonine-protein kinase [Blastocatellia bacterium]|nr:serine/threonine-protein kinase [Blastocatellia bacterium]